MTNTAYPVLNSYLDQLKNKTSSDSESHSKLWIDAENRVQGRFLNCSLSSVFLPAFNLDGETVQAQEALAHSYSEEDRGLSIWQLLMHAASDEESIELDRLARLIHAMNFFRQANAVGTSLFIDVHDRLLAAVGSNHGAAFHRIMTSMALPLSQIILQLPLVKNTSNWALAHIVDNYKKNGFQVATRANNIAEALRHAEALRPHLIRLDISRIGNGDNLKELFERASNLSIQLLFTRIEYNREHNIIKDAAHTMQNASSNFLVQGPLFAQSSSTLQSPNNTKGLGKYFESHAIASI